MGKMRWLLVPFLFLSLGCLSLRDPTISDGIVKCESLDLCKISVEHGHGGCFSPRSDCLAILAANHSDASICEEAGDALIFGNASAGCSGNCLSQREGESARDYCYYSVSGLLGDYRICGKISDMATRDGCYHDSAIISWNTTLCDSVQNGYLRSDCINRTTYG
jgi:hypothetical protein